MPEDSSRVPGAALVTGGTSGIGLAVTEALVEEGIAVVCAGRDPERLALVAERHGDKVHALQLDVTDLRGCNQFIAELPPGFENIDILVNNAGHDTGGRRLFYEGLSEDWTRIIDTNVNGLLRMTHAVLPGMLLRNHGHIINLGSVAGVYSYRTGTAYNASKFAVHGFSEALRKDLDHSALRVTEILPGLVKTRFAENRNRGDREAAEAFYASFPAWLLPEDVARAVIYAIQQPPNVNISQLMIEPVRKRAE